MTVSPGAPAPPGAVPAPTLGARVGPLPGWQVGTLVDAWEESASARTLVLAVPSWPGHLAGQHVDLRLRAPDGYVAERSYSIGGPVTRGPDGVPRIALTVQRVADGEVSTYLTDTFAVGYPVELRGPVGGWFVWAPDAVPAPGEPTPLPGPPVLLVAGGSGIVPLVAMVRERRRAGSRTPFRLVVSVRTPADRLFVEEVTRTGTDGVDVTVLYTRAAPLDDGSDEPGPARRDPGRMTPADLAAHGWPAELEPACFVCGPTPFVEAAAQMLLALGHDAARIRTERFGPAGD
ncbi:FAD-binding oxidoreductase [Cellulomonas sp. PhB143]|uniref:FAD-binding oxidoreductase n=1 Tax=Cellulomonas sp. PhB143 TaxID=2485186 RepID=UPI000F91A019|nr:FAD-binding oxidoreductase [Cellulomonas sp. PhB143]ROS73351.1 ferredoxin-NADP reductase [Cellulomonas sp. PhB143]